VVTPELTDSHHTPCAELIATQKIVERHTQQLSNNTSWQERLDRRVDQLTILALGTFSSALLTAAAAVIGLLKR